MPGDLSSLYTVLAIGRGICGRERYPGQCQYSAGRVAHVIDERTPSLLVINWQNTAPPRCPGMRSDTNWRATGCAGAIEPLVPPQQPAAEQHRWHLQREAGDPHVPRQWIERCATGQRGDHRAARILHQRQDGQADQNGTNGSCRYDATQPQPFAVNVRDDTDPPSRTSQIESSDWPLLLITARNFVHRE